MLATDRDLLAMEPRLFHDVAWIGQRVHGAEGVAIQGGGLEVVDPSGPFTPGRVEAGGVLLLDGLAVEVVSVADASTAGISLVRGAAEDPAIPAGSLGATARLEAFTFRPQLEIAHRQALALFGLADGAEADGELAPLASVIDTGGLRTLAAVGALGLVHASAAPIVDASGGASGKAERYRAWHAAIVRSLGVPVDDTGDGVADRTLRATAATLRRV
jgi:hypothetical protein